MSVLLFCDDRPRPGLGSLFQCLKSLVGTKPLLGGWGGNDAVREGTRAKAQIGFVYLLIRIFLAPPAR
jgi:hypothetical protein